VQAARAAHKPSVDFIATSNWYDDNPGFDSHSSSVMGVVSLDLYAGGRHQGEIGAALAEENEMQWRVQALEQSVRNDVRAAHDNLREARARHATAADNVERARENVGSSTGVTAGTDHTHRPAAGGTVLHRRTHGRTELACRSRSRPLGAYGSRRARCRAGECRPMNPACLVLIAMLSALPLAGCQKTGVTTTVAATGGPPGILATS
jgi:hypothetical protein